MPSLVAVVPAAGVGKRMQASCPKQYLSLNQFSILEHTVLRLLSHHLIEKVIVVINENDEYFADTSLPKNDNVSVVFGGKERVDSVLYGLKSIDSKRFPWVLVHDAARPCLTLKDLDNLISQCIEQRCGAILAAPVRDTMKRVAQGVIEKTVERENLWHALTPQMFNTDALITSIETALNAGAIITDEASAVEFTHDKCMLVEGSSENIKITHPDDLAFAQFILNKQQNSTLGCSN